MVKKDQTSKPIDDLTTKERLFVEYYTGAADFNATLAARMAGYKNNEKTIRSMAYENLTKPHIELAVNAALRQRAKDNEALLADLIKRYQQLAFTNIEDYLEFNSHFVRVKDSSQISRYALGAIKSVKNTKEGVQFELHDSKGAADSLARILGAFTDNTRNVDGDYESLIERLRKQDGTNN